MPLTKHDVAAIWVDVRSQSEIATHYGVGRSTISAIKNSTNWAWFTSQLGVPVGSPQVHSNRFLHRSSVDLDLIRACLDQFQAGDPEPAERMFKDFQFTRIELHERIKPPGVYAGFVLFIPPFGSNRKSRNQPVQTGAFSMTTETLKKGGRAVRASVWDRGGVLERDPDREPHRFDCPVLQLHVPALIGLIERFTK